MKKIISPNGVVSYILGTAHLSDEGLVSMVDKTLEELKPARLLSELCTDKKVDIPLSKMGHPPTKELREKAERLVPILKFFPEDTPAMVLGVSATMFLMGNISMDKVMDMYLVEESKKRGIMVTSIDSPGSQLEALNLLSPEDSNDNLNVLLNRIESGEIHSVIADTVKSVVTGDLSYIRKWMGETEKKISEALCVNRDRFMITQSLEYLNKDTCLIAVGLLHVEGISMELEKLGFKVENM